MLDWLAALRGAAPRTPLVLYSGTIDEELASYAEEFRAVAVVAKPFNVGQLVAAVRGVIAGR